jgi:biotin carboxylase
MKNVFVIGLEPFNLALLRRIAGADAYNFRDLLAYDEAVRPRDNRIDLNGLLDVAERRLAGFTGSLDAIIGYWDFPSSVIVPVLARRHGLPGPPLEAVAACEHKYWCRTEQQRALPDLAPRFRAVDPFADDPLSQIDLPFPFWLKPVKAHSSYLGFKIRNEADFDACLPVIRANIGHIGEPFDAFLAMVDVPDPVAPIGGHYCIAEEIISAGRQCTLEGYAYRGEVVVYGVIDSIRSGQHRSCFTRYQYPSRLPRRVQDRMIAAAQRFVRHIGYDDAAFNVEFYWDPRSDAIRMLEVNTRVSKSHSPLFLMVDGEPHPKVAIDLALGRHPDPPHRQGKYRLSAKFMIRVFEDGIVIRLPTPDDIARLQERFPDALFRVLTREGIRLAHMRYQDSYSFEIAELFLGADSRKALQAEYGAALELLPFEFRPMARAAA